MISDELGFIVTALVAFGAGFIRGFTGFGGPAFMLAILTLFYTPLVIISKILVIELIASSYLFANIWRTINWRNAMALTLSSIIIMPLGQWLLLEIDPQVMRRAIAVIILTMCLIMLFGYRYQTPLSVAKMVAVGLISGIVFGATYIALVSVAAILLGPYDKHQARTLLITWAFLTACWFAILALINNTVATQDWLTALPGAATYFIGTWLGSRWFSNSAEHRYRQVALITLLILSALGFIN